MDSTQLNQFFEKSARDHSHLCPRQILGVRMGLYAGGLLNLTLPQSSKRLLVVTETDGCFADGLSAATNATVGHRTLRVEDYGKTAAVFIDTKTERTIRIVPALNIRQQACEYVPQESHHYFAQLQAYQIIPDEVMFTMQNVMLVASIQSILSQPAVHVNCGVCGEEIMNEREIHQSGMTLCHTCAHGGYYRLAERDCVPLYAGQQKETAL
jgi:formylmethanofuran dehydrogenase subunit E